MKKFLSPSEKIAQLRKKYNITQEALAFNDKFAKISLSFVEMGRRGITENFMQSVCENFNEYFEKNKIDDYADFHELIKSKEQQAKEYLDDLIEKKSVITTEVNSIEEAMFEIASDDHKYYSLKIGSIFFEAENMKLAKNFAERGLLGAFLKKDTALLKELILLTMKANHYLENFQDNIFLFEKFQKYISAKPDQIFYRIYYNYGVSMFRSNKKKEAFEILGSLYKNKKITDHDTLFNIKNAFAAINYLEFNKMKKAVSIYDSLKNIAMDDRQKYYIYANLLDIGIRDKKIIDLENTILESKKLLCNNDLNSYEIFHLYSVIGESFSILKNFVHAKKYFIEAFNIEKDSFVLNKNKFYLIIKIMKIVSNLVENNSKKEKNFVEELDKIYKKLFEQEKNYEPLIYFVDYFSKWKRFSVQDYLTFFKK